MTRLRLKINVEAAEFKSGSSVSAGAVAIIYNCLLDLDNLEYSETRTHHERKCLAEVRRMYLDQLADLIIDYAPAARADGDDDNSHEIPF